MLSTTETKTKKPPTTHSRLRWKIDSNTEFDTIVFNCASSRRNSGACHHQALLIGCPSETAVVVTRQTTHRFGRIDSCISNTSLFTTVMLIHIQVSVNFATGYQNECVVWPCNESFLEMFDTSQQQSNR
jgi:hypothetical protein